MFSTGLGLTDVGKVRELNEDSLYINNDLGLYIVSDGMGGHAAGEVASSSAVHSAASYLEEHHSIIKRVLQQRAEPAELQRISEKSVVKACSDVYRLAMSKPGHAGMGCTLTMLLVSGMKAAMAHVGDSRLYLCRDGKVHQLSTDHTMANELASAGMISSDEVKDHRLSHVLTKAIGSQESVRVETLILDVLPGDRFLLCSDGFSEYLENGEWLSEQLAREDFEAIPQDMVDFANKSGGKDNITILLVQIEAEKDEKPFALSFSEEVQIKLDALGSVFLFENLTLAQLTRILNVSQVEEYDAGEVVHYEGEQCSRVLIAIEGLFSLSCPNGKTIELGSGDSVGETTLLHPRPCRATLKSNEKSRLLILGRDPFKALIKARPWLGVSLLDRLGRRLSVDLDRLTGEKRERIPWEESKVVEPRDLF